MEQGDERQAPEVRRAEAAAIAVPPGLSIALQHPALSSSPQVLCAAARSCKAWRQAVQQCEARNTAVVLDVTASLQRLRSFRRWLPRHAALVRSITATAGAASWGLHVDGRPMEGHLEAAQQLLQQALQAATGTVAGTAAAADAGAHSGAGLINRAQQRQPLQQHGWRLASFSCDLPGAPALLHVLPAHSLTHLRLELQTGDVAERASADLSQLVRLSSLQQLHLQGALFGYKLQDGCLAGIAQLSQLTSLEFTCKWNGLKQQLQQLLMKPLPLQQLEVWVSDDCNQSPELPSLAHLTQLTELSTTGMSPGDATLPAQLHALVFRQCRDLAPVLALKQLQRLHVWPIDVEQHQVLQLASLPALQELCLSYSKDSVSADELAAAAAPTWVLLPQLRALDVKLLPLEQSGEEEVAAILAGAAAATQLTSLQLSFASEGVYVSLAREYAMPMCACLAGLTGLQELRLHAACVVPGDALALTALTGLTSLVLSYMYQGVRAAEATALARSLKHLKHLDLSWCSANMGSIAGTACLAVVGQLKQLTYLNLEGIDGLTQQGLMQLTGLTCLQELDVDTDEDVSCEVLRMFWAAVRRQQQ